MPITTGTAVTMLPRSPSCSETNPRSTARGRLGRDDRHIASVPTTARKGHSAQRNEPHLLRFDPQLHGIAGAQSGGIGEREVDGT